MPKASSRARSRKQERCRAAASPAPEAGWQVLPALLLSLALIAAVSFVYVGVRHFGFVNWDDPQYITDNAHVLGGLSWPNVRWALTDTRAAGLWLPLTWLSLMFDATVWGSDPGGYHVTNVVLHAANSVLLFSLLYGTTRALGRSAFVAALFAVHPLQVESVAWVTERKDVLSTLFLLLTLWAYVAYANRPATLRYLLVIATLVLGLMAKPMLVTVPFLLLLVDVWPLRRLQPNSTIKGRPVRRSPSSNSEVNLKRLLIEKVPLLFIAVFASIVTLVAQKNAGAMSTLDALPFQSRVPVALTSYVTYVVKTFWPSELAGFYPYHVPSPIQVFGCAVLLVGITAIVLRAPKRYLYLPVGWLWFMGALFPVIGLVQVGMQMRADRFTYVPAIGLFIVVAWGAHDIAVRWPRARVALIGGALGVVVACGALARIQAGYWKDSVTFWRHALDATYDNARAHGNLGLALANLGNKDEALMQYNQAIRIAPQLPDVQINLANLLAGRGETEDAIAHYKQALRVSPNNIDAHNGLASALDDQKKYDEAIVHYRDALRIAPGSARVVNNLGAALVHQGKLNEALPYLLEAAKLAPEDADYHYNAGAVLEELGRFGEAGREAEEALRRRPNHPEAAGLLERLRVSGRIVPASR